MMEEWNQAGFVQHDAGRRNEIANNDFSQAVITDNVG
jgi:hypothetical protein